MKKNIIKTFIISIVFSFGPNSFVISQDSNIESERIFYDYIKAFSKSAEIQMNSISFPLKYIVDNDTLLISKENWKFKEYRFGWEISTILFTGDSINFEKDFYLKNSETDYKISVYITSEQKFKEFYFNNKKDFWQLYQIKEKKIEKNDNEFFFDFINQFANNKEFIRERTSKDIKYITWEENPKNLIEKTIDFHDFENNEFLFRNIYLDEINNLSDKIILYIKGEMTGYHSEYYFSRINKKWYLIKYINLGV